MPFSHLKMRMVRSSIFLKFNFLFGFFLLVFPYDWLSAKLNALSTSGTAMLVWGGAFNRSVFFLKCLSALLVLASGAILYFGFPSAFSLKSLNCGFQREKEVFYRWVRVNARRERKDLLVLGFLFVLGVILRANFLDRAMQIDESEAFLGYVAGPFISIFANYYPSDHILHNILTRGFVGLLGSSPLAIRLSAFIPGVLLTPAIYFFCRQFFKNRLAALLAAAFVCVSSESIEFATNSRGYASVMLVSTLAGGLTAMQIYSPKVWGWVFLGTLHGLGFAFHPTYLFPFLCCQLWFGWSLLRQNSKFLKSVVALVSTNFLSGFILAIFYVPTWILSGPERLAGNGFVRRFTYGELWLDLKRFFPEFLSTFHADFPLVLRITMGIGILSYLIKNKEGWRVRAGLLAVPTLLVLGMYILRPMDLEVRFLIFTLPILLACEAVGIVSLLPKQARLFKTGWFMVLLGSGLSFYSYQVTKPGLKPSVESISLDEGHQIAQFLKPLLKKGDQVVYPAARGANLKYYFHVLGMDPSFLSTGEGAERIFFVLNLRLDDRYAYADNYKNFDPKDYTTPLVVAKYPGAEVTILERKVEGQTTPRSLSGYPEMSAKALRFLARPVEGAIQPMH